MVKAEIITMAKKAADAWRNTNTYHQAAQIIDMLAEELEQNPTLTPPNEWVSVEDRLPASGQNVIATNGSDVGEAWYASLSRSWYRYNGLEWNRICREVTHWMPLPEPPVSRPPEGEEDNND